MRKILVRPADKIVPQATLLPAQGCNWFLKQPLDRAKHIEGDAVLRVYPYIVHDSIETRAVTKWLACHGTRNIQRCEPPPVTL